MESILELRKWAEEKTKPVSNNQRTVENPLTKAYREPHVIPDKV